MRRDRKLTVEECSGLDSGSLAKKILQAGTAIQISDGIPTIEVGMQYSVILAGETKNVNWRLQLSATRPIFGGFRWWICCPYPSEGDWCGRRVGKLYLPPGATYFGCRHCHDLTYRSVQEHDKRVDFYRENPEALLAVLNAPSVKFSTLALALKACR